LTLIDAVPVATGVLAVRGSDARKFLHGQLSQDVLGLATDRVALAGLHNAQGRVLAVLHLVPLDETDLLLLLPRELVVPVRDVLAKFVLRAKVRLGDESEAWALAGVWPEANHPIDAAGVGHLQSEGELRTWQHAADGRRLQLRPSTPDETPVTQTARAWRAADIAAGLPTVTAATSGAFVAQMLNLDLLEGISFKKGCYTGQEVIARAHYRGRVKRRLQRFVTQAPASLQAGDTHVLPDGRSCDVVTAIERDDGRCEFLAVTTYDTNAPQAGALPLPYALPA
jgi:folate-binding protein YgfZ